MIAIKTTIKDIEAQTGLKRLGERLTKPQQALGEMGLVLLRSIARTFKAGGRPVRWKPSTRAKAASGKTLVQTARLKNSITMKVSGKTLRVGTNVVYARIHHLGGRINKNVTVKQHWRHMNKAFGKSIPARSVLVKSHQREMDTTIPARPYLVIQAGDWRVFNRILGDYVTS